MLTSRQMEILRILLHSGSLNVNHIVRKGQSPTRLKRTLQELVDRRYLRMELKGKKQRIYTITNLGIRCLLKYESELAEESINRTIREIQEAAKMSPTDHDWRKHAEAILKGKVRLTEEEQGELFTGPAYKWMLASNELLSIAISIYKKTNEEDLRRMFPKCKNPLDVYFRTTESGTLDRLPRERLEALREELEDAKRDLQMIQKQSSH